MECDAVTRQKTFRNKKNFARRIYNHMTPVTLSLNNTIQKQHLFYEKCLVCQRQIQYKSFLFRLSSWRVKLIMAAVHWCTEPSNQVKKYYFMHFYARTFCWSSVVPGTRGPPPPPGPLDFVYPLYPIVTTLHSTTHMHIILIASWR